jgi:hypothetical protein
LIDSLKQNKIKSLKIMKCSSNDEDCLANLKLFKYLKEVSIESSPFVTNKVIDDITKVKSLKKLYLLYLNNKEINDDAFQNLDNLVNLNTLHILVSSNLTDKFLEKIKNLTDLISLKLTYTQITDDGVKNYFPNLTNIKTLELSGSKKITDESLDLFKKYLKLESLNVDNCSQILFETSTNDSLIELNISNNKNLSNDFFKYCTNLTQLTNLNLFKTSFSKFENMECMQNLTELNLYCVKDFSDEDTKIFSKFKNLKILEISHTNIKGIYCHS